MRTNIDANIFWIDSGPIMFRSSYYNWNMFKVDSGKNAPCFLLSSTAARCELVWYALLFHLILCPSQGIVSSRCVVETWIESALLAENLISLPQHRFVMVELSRTEALH